LRSLVQRETYFTSRNTSSPLNLSTVNWWFKDRFLIVQINSVHPQKKKTHPRRKPRLFEMISFRGFHRGHCRWLRNSRFQITSLRQLPVSWPIIRW
jgi:hypothetical protein